ncbi:MAG: hypothetical protein KC613_14965, partial [Myxococcales bacterium]|nr:hypothetical protein [Myxococcales bacterium]
MRNLSRTGPEPHRLTMKFTYQDLNGGFVQPRTVGTYESTGPFKSISVAVNRAAALGEWAYENVVVSCTWTEDAWREKALVENHPGARVWSVGADLQARQGSKVDPVTPATDPKVLIDVPAPIVNLGLPERWYGGQWFVVNDQAGSFLVKPSEPSLDVDRALGDLDQLGVPAAWQTPTAAAGMGADHWLFRAARPQVARVTDGGISEEPLGHRFGRKHNRLLEGAEVRGAWQAGGRWHLAFGDAADPEVLTYAAAPAQAAEPWVAQGDPQRLSALGIKPDAPVVAVATAPDGSPCAFTARHAWPKGGAKTALADWLRVPNDFDEGGVERPVQGAFWCRGHFYLIGPDQMVQQATPGTPGTLGEATLGTLARWLKAEGLDPADADTRLVTGFQQEGTVWVLGADDRAYRLAGPESGALTITAGVAWPATRTLRWFPLTAQVPTDHSLPSGAVVCVGPDGTGYYFKGRRVRSHSFEDLKASIEDWRAFGGVEVPWEPIEGFFEGTVPKDQPLTPTWGAATTAALAAQVASGGLTQAWNAADGALWLEAGGQAVRLGGGASPHVVEERRASPRPAGQVATLATPHGLQGFFAGGECGYPSEQEGARVRTARRWGLIHNPILDQGVTAAFHVDAGLYVLNATHCALIPIDDQGNLSAWQKPGHPIEHTLGTVAAGVRLRDHVFVFRAAGSTADRASYEYLKWPANQAGLPAKPAW